MAGALGQFAIGGGLAEAELARCVIDGEAEVVDAVEVDRHAGEIDILPGRVGLDRSNQFDHPFRLLGGARDTGMAKQPALDCFAAAFGQAEPDQALFAPGNAHEADHCF